MVTPNTMNLLKKHLEIIGGQVQTLYVLLLEKKYVNLKMIMCIDFSVPVYEFI